jgi:hypothetical protein
MATQLTMLDLVKAVSATARTDTEVVATVVYLVNSGAVRLCGSFRGARFDLEEVGMTAAAVGASRSSRSNFPDAADRYSAKAWMRA